MDALSTGLDHLVKLVEDGGLESLDDAGLVGFLWGLERVRNRLPLVDHAAIGAVVGRDLPAKLTQSTAQRMLAAVLRLAPGEASRRVRAAEAVGPRRSMLGETLDPVRPQLAAAQRAGEISAEQVGIVERALARVDRPGFDPADVAAGEELLTRFAQQFGPKELKRLAEQIVDAIDPDGTLPNDQLNLDRRFFHLRPTKNGGYAGEFRLTVECGAKLQALLGPLAKPKMNTTVGLDGTLIEQPDARHHGQRVHDALADVCDRLLRADTTIPESGGTPATVIVTIDLDDLLAKTGYGISSDGNLIRTHTVRELINSAEMYTASSTPGVRCCGWVGPGGSQAVARPSPCTPATAVAPSPGCDTAPEWCERHHIIGWVDGGSTDLNNLTLLCRYHHHNFASRGWGCRINPNGLPEWSPPWWIDRSRTSMINTRIRGTITARTHRRQ